MNIMPIRNPIIREKGKDPMITMITIIIEEIKDPMIIAIMIILEEIIITPVPTPTIKITEIDVIIHHLILPSFIHQQLIQNIHV